MGKKDKEIQIKEISSTMGDAPTSVLKEKKLKEKKRWSKKKRIIIFSTIGLVLAGVLTYLLWPSNTSLEILPQDENTENIDIDPNDTESPLNGVMATPEKASRRPLGVMVENHPDSRPQSGLDKADVVYEAVTEGGITRFLALYQINDVSEIGPVRSARVPFVNFANEYKSCYSHVGGADEALALINQLSEFCDLNQFSLSKYYWRDTSRYAPHNVYTTTNKLRDAASSRSNSLAADFDSWGFKEDAEKEERGTIANVNINFSSASYKVSYSYSSSSNSYLRKQAGYAHKDKNSGNQIEAKTVIVQHVTSWRDGQYTLMKHTGTGKASIYMDGRKIKGTWKKFNDSSRTKFYDEKNQEIAFNRGQIWIEVATAGVTETN